MNNRASGWEDFLRSTLLEIESAGLLRSLREVHSPQRARVSLNGRSLLNFSSNDYLGLAFHPALREAACEEWERSGFGTGASRLVCGTLAAHERLEFAIAGFKRTESALTFSSGYAAAMGTIPAVCSKEDVIILDKLCHACLVDAARLSGARLRVFPHNDLNKLESHLRWAEKSHPGRRILVLAESVYSMDGDRAPLREIVEIKDRFGAWLFLDEAHGIGVLGTNGRGLAEAEGVSERVEIQMGTLGKALGAHGAYIAGSRHLRGFLINRARSFIYTTSPPASVAAAAEKALEILAGPEGSELVKSLWSNIRTLCAARNTSEAASAIVPVIIGGESAALSASARLLDAGFLVPAIRYPTVAKAAARLRVTLSAAHQQADVLALASALQQPG
ncbi:MAG: 8-amino-7-oxononanoate synthase [Verrucomicrobiae bacterium]